MGPKNVPATRAGGPQRRDLSWIDRMYVKFETICVEVDKNPSMLLQETSKFVESQVNAVGNNVKKLCTELIQDLLSPEGAEKKLECALHCKCHCMDSEKPKPTDGAKGVSTRQEIGVDHKDSTFNESTDQEKDVMKMGGGNVEFPKDTKQADPLNADVSTRKSQSHETSDLVCLEFNNVRGHDGNQEQPKPMTTIKQFDMEIADGHNNCEEKSGLAEGIESNATQTDNVEMICKLGAARAYTVPIGGNTRGLTSEATVCRSEAAFAELASAPKLNDESLAKPINGAVNSHLEIQKHTDLLQKQEECSREYIGEMQERAVECLFVMPALDAFSQQVSNGEIGHFLKIDDGDTNCKYDPALSTEVMQGQYMMDGNRMDRNLESMENEDLKIEEANKILQSFTMETVSDEEQSAHWFVDEDLRKAIQSEIFNSENSRCGDSFVSEPDLDWELL